jgi:hypothetical protein
LPPSQPALPSLHAPGNWTCGSARLVYIRAPIRKERCHNGLVSTLHSHGERGAVPGGWVCATVGEQGINDSNVPQICGADKCQTVLGGWVCPAVRKKCSNDVKMPMRRSVYECSAASCGRVRPAVCEQSRDDLYIPARCSSHECLAVPRRWVNAPVRKQHANGGRPP